MATPTPMDDLLVQLRRGGMSNPFYLLANQFLPRNFNDVIRWSRFVLVNSPTLFEVVRKYSTYPVTSFIVKGKVKSHEETWKKVIKKLKLKTTLEEIGFSYHTMGNCYFSIYFPLMRMCVCPSCTTEYNYSDSLHFIKFKNGKFEGVCPKCNYKGPLTRKDRKSLSIEDMSIVTWPVENVSVHKNPITGTTNYYYTIPNYVKRAIQSGDPLYIATTPWSIIEAVIQGKDYLFDKNNFYHMKNLSFGDVLNGYGLPPLISTYSFIFYQVLLRKANEAVAAERLTSMRIISPRPMSGNSDPSMAINLASFARNMNENLKRFKKDPNHVMISPVPTEINNVGGDGRALLVTQELQAAGDEVLLGMGVSRDLMAGTTNWTSSTVGLRLLENTMSNYVEQLLEALDWIVTKVNAYFEISDVDISLVPFKLMDDDATRQQIGAMYEKGLVSPSTWLEAFGLDLKEEQEKSIQDQVELELSKLDLEHRVKLARFTKATDIVSNTIAESEVSRADLEAGQLAIQIMSANPETQRQMLMQIRSENPAMYQMVISHIESANQMPVSGDADQGLEEGQPAGGEPSSGQQAEQPSQQPPQ